MLIQVYKDEDFVRIFLDRDVIAALSFSTINLKEAKEHKDRLILADLLLRVAGFKRREKWVKTTWGSEAKIRRQWNLSLEL